MIRASKVSTIARFEFRNVVHRVGFLVATFGLPIFLATIGGVLGFVQTQFLVERLSEAGIVAIVDSSGVLRDDTFWTTPDELDPVLRALVSERGINRPGSTGHRVTGIDTYAYVLYDDEASALAALAEEQVDQGVYVFEADYLETGRVVYYAADRPGAMVGARGTIVEPALNRLLRDRLLRRHTSDTIRLRVLDPMDLERIVVSVDGEQRSDGKRLLETAIRVGIPFALGAFLLTALLFSSGYLVQTVALDKESKIVEVLLSSADPDEILLGKLLGLGGAGLVQFFVWTSMVLLGASAVAASLAASDVVFPWTALMFAPLFFVLGYLFIGSLMLSTGSMGSSIAESQKLTMGWAVLAIAPLFVLVMLIEEPHGVLGQVLSIIPFSAPLTLIVRLSVDPAGVSSFDLALSILSLVLSTWLSIRIGARLFRVGLLISGSRPSWREVLRQARLLD